MQEKFKFLCCYFILFDFNARCLQFIPLGIHNVFLFEIVS